jgi:hypothetical protein
MGVALGVGATAVIGSISAVNEANNTVLANAVAVAVPSATETTITTYATGASPTWISAIICSGMEYGKFRYFEGVTPKIVLRGGADRNVFFNLTTPIKVVAGETIAIKVEHFVTGETPDFEASIIGYKGT